MGGGPVGLGVPVATGPSTEFASRSITDPEGNIYVGGIYNSSPLTLNGV